MSALGHKRTFCGALAVSAQGQKRTFGSVPLVMHLSHVLRTLLDVHLACALKNQSATGVITFAERVLEIDKHDVIAARLELNTLPGLDFDVAQFTHLRDTIFHCQCVKLKTIRNVD